MDDVPAELRDAWERATSSGNPLDALQGVRDLKEALTPFEARLARHGLATGATWETIGAALGTSRQAAWERLRHAIDSDILADENPRRGRAGSARHTKRRTS